MIRFIKKAAHNLSQDFNFFIPSKRLAINEQKRMLAKQLNDFLHVYKKDTEQIRLELKNQLKLERKLNHNKLIDEKSFQSLLYKCCESELEEIMSTYMKSSQDCSVFLGVSRSDSKINENGLAQKSINTSSKEKKDFFQSKQNSNNSQKDDKNKTTSKAKDGIKTSAIFENSGIHREQHKNKYTKSAIDGKCSGDELIDSFDSCSSFSSSESISRPNSIKSTINSETIRTVPLSSLTYTSNQRNNKDLNPFNNIPKNRDSLKFTNSSFDKSIFKIN